MLLIEYIFLQNKTIKRGSQAIQSYIWDFNVAYMEEGEKEFTYLQDELGSTVRLLEQGGESQIIYGYDEFGEDTYCTQGHLQPFGYTGYRYDKVADTYFAQAREYMPGVGRFAGEDWIKGEIYYPTSLNQYGYCFGNPEKFVDLDGKTARERAEDDILQNKNGSPYVGVFYLNIESGAFGNGHAAMMLLRSDDTGDLYSFVGDANSPLTIFRGYNDANVNYAYGIDVGNLLKDKNDKYSFDVVTREGIKEDDYNRAIYFPITNESGKAMADAARETILKTNGIGIDEKDYKLLTNNCDQNARRWIQAGGIALETGGHVAPNLIYDYNVRQMNIRRKVKYINGQYGDLYDIWNVLHPQHYFVTENKNCITSN